MLKQGERTFARAAWLACVLGGAGCASTPRPVFQVLVPDTAAHMVVVPFTLGGGWILVRAVARGHTAMLNLDTGSDWMGLDRSWAKAIGARPHHPHSGWALTEGADPFDSAYWALVDTMHLDGDLRLIHHWIMLESWSALSEADGRLVQGAIGQDLLQRFTVEIDYQARLLRLYDPGRYSYSGSGVHIPFARDTSPIIQATLITSGGDSIKARLRLDTGGAHACVILNTPFVEQHNLKESLAPTVEGPPVIGLDGLLHVRVGGVSELLFGGLTIDTPAVILGRERKGLLIDSSYDGTIGNSVFHDSRLIFDYARRQVIIEPGPSLGRDCSYDRSGLSLTSAAPTFRRFRVRSVVPHSPAADGGVRPGDELVSLDGRPAADLDFEDIRQALMIEGAIRQLRLARGADTVLVTFTLHRLF